MKNKYRTLTNIVNKTTLVLLMSPTISITSLAQDHIASGLEEIVVTAQRREKSLQETPIAITAFTSDKLEKLGIFNVEQVGEFAPNVWMSKQPSTHANMGIVIRGIGMSDTALTADPKVGVYIDGILVSKTTGGLFDIADLERIEVLRGPQGTLFGRNTTGGAINVTTRKPSGELLGKAEASVGSFGYLRYGISLDFPIMSNFAGQVTYNHMETDGWARNRYTGVPITPNSPDNPVKRKLGLQDNDSYRLALRWTPFDTITIDYAYDKTDNSGVAAPFQVLKVKDHLNNGFTNDPVDFQMIGGSLYQQMAAAVGNPKKRKKNFTFDTMVGSYLDVTGHSFVTEWQASEDVTLKYLFGARYTTYSNGADFDGGAWTARDLFYGVYAGNSGEISVPGFHGQLIKGRVELQSHEMQIIGSALNEQLQYTGGIFYYNEKVKESDPPTLSVPISFLTPQGIYTPGLGPLYDAGGFCPAEYGGNLCIGSQRLPIPGSSDPYRPGLIDFTYGQKSKSYALYGQATYSFTEQLELTAGLRYTKDDKNAFLYHQDLLQFVPSLTLEHPLRSKDDWNNISYLLNLRYAFNDDVNAYITYATGYNGGGYNARANTVSAFVTPYDKEEIKSVEIGVKSELFDRRLRLNAALFNNDYSDMQIAQFEGGASGASSRTVNAGEATIRGVEFDIVAIPVDGLTIDLSYGYLDAKFDKYIARNPVTDKLEDISNRMKVPHAPKNTAALGVQYDFAPFSFGMLSARLDITFKDKFVFHSYENEWTSPASRKLVNGRVSLNNIKFGCCDRSSELSLSLWGKNLTDEEYISWGIDFSSLGFAGATFGDPRSYGVDLVYRYR